MFGQVDGVTLHVIDGPVPRFSNGDKQRDKPIARVREQKPQLLQEQQGWRLSQNIASAEEDPLLHDAFGSPSSFGACTDRGDWCLSDHIGIQP